MSDEQMTLFDADEWTSSPEAIPASPSHSPASKKALKTIATSGRQCLSLLSKKDPLLLLAKTLLVTSRWGSTRCFLTWKVKATPQGRLLFQLAPSMPRTEGTASGLLHTPTAKANQMSPDMQKRGSGWGPKMWATPAAADCQGTTGGGQGKSLRTDVRMWPTPQAADHKNMDTAGQKMLSSEVKLWPTPHANCHTGAGSQGRAGGDNRQTAVKMWPTATARDWRSGKASEATMQRNSRPLSETVGGSLNPAWVEWLMGYPEGWTDLNR